MSWLATVAVMIVIGSAIALWQLRRLQQRKARPRGKALGSLRTVIAPEIVAQLGQVHKSVQAQQAEWWTPSQHVDPHPATANVESALVLHQWKDAVNLAELAMAATPQDPRAALLLAWALVSAGHASAAGGQMLKLQSLPAAQWQQLGALAPYVAARARHLIFEQRAGATELMPALVTTAEFAIMSLASTNGADAWLVGKSEVEFDATQSRAAIDDHRRETTACLELTLQALQLQPLFIDAAYLAARYAIKLGLVVEGKRLLLTVADRMTGRPDVDYAIRDAAVIKNPTQAVAAAMSPPPPPPMLQDEPARGKRSKSLRVL
jgi:hypothetical protein